LTAGSTVPSPQPARAAHWWRRGDADISPDLLPRDVADVAASQKLKIVSTPMTNTLKYLALSVTTKPFDDVRVRQ